LRGRQHTRRRAARHGDVPACDGCRDHGAPTRRTNRHRQA
jgi:hypothetical protein